MVGEPLDGVGRRLEGAALSITEPLEELAVAAHEECDAPVADVEVARVGVSKGDQVLIGCVRHASCKTQVSLMVKIDASYLTESDLFILRPVVNFPDAI